MMTPFERYTGMIENHDVDIVPRLPILMAFAADYIGSNYAAFASDYRVLVEANIRCAEAFGIDQMNTMSDPYRETQGFGAEIIYEKNGVPHCVRPPFDEALDPASIKKPDPLTASRMRDRIDAVREYKRRVGGQYSIMGWVEGPAAEAGDLRGMENFLCDLIEEPELSGELMDLCVEVAIDFARIQIESGADTIGIGDAICSQMSVDLYHELVWPREQRLVSAIRAMGACVRLHICGNITHLLPFIKQLEVNIVDIDWMVDMRHAREALGPGKVLAGNLDPVNAVLRGTPEDIRRKSLEIYAQVGNPCMVNAGCEIPPGTPEENLRALCEPIPFLAR
ncbi:MAG: uroporphyrinogen decarboxylase family protein [Methylacidiphilales bacterium]|nr:uroporphyrinogen decarboxylase family protein [Candidatus Methylacidiphilales bacterium]